MAVATHMLARVAVSRRSCRWLAFNCTVVPLSARGAEVRHSWSSAVAAVSGAPWHPLSSPRSTRRQRSVVLRSSDRESGRLCYAHHIWLCRLCHAATVFHDLVDLVDSLKDDLVRLQNKQQAKVRQLGNDSPQVTVAQKLVLKCEHKCNTPDKSHIVLINSNLG